MGAMDVARQVRETIEREKLLAPGDTVVVGVSGGPDSLCLLHVLRALSPALSLTLIVAHLHHGLRGDEADADAEFVRQLAADWGLPCEIGHADVPALARRYRLAIEETARRARYAFLGQVAQRAHAPIVAVAHNADDQTETVLMHFLRGAGISGLRGMLYRTRWGDYRLLEPLERALGDMLASPPNGEECPRWLIRPLLDVPRADVEAYCAAYGLTPRFDRSNLDTTFYRNRLRHELLPFLETYNPAIREILRRSAVVIADDYEVLRAALMDAWTQVERPASPSAIAFDLKAWRALPRGLQRATLREAVHRLRRTLRDINFIHIEQALRVAQRGETGEKATLPQGLMLRVDYDRIEISDEHATPTPAGPQVLTARPLACPGITPLTEGWEIEARLLSTDELPAQWSENLDPWQAWLDADVLGPAPIVRPRQPGDRFQPLGMGGKFAKLGEFMINVKLPAALRDAWPLIEGAQGIAWVVGYRLDDRYKIQATTRRVVHLRCRRWAVEER
ncbi:MAG: tRNA lysidine(34) synthetase TilS [Anaerolineae bacterium]|nr:tRNA lysidine(34) synthetase TilS [Anaerolineae bacterium]MDW8100803.1 tRNA lysidine(34) synthetase TilS [Anaerolineae bacterium]